MFPTAIKESDALRRESKPFTITDAIENSGFRSDNLKPVDMPTLSTAAPAALSIALRRISAGLIAMVAVTHVALHARQMADPVGWIVDAALLATALGLGATTTVRTSKVFRARKFD